MCCHADVDLVCFLVRRSILESAHEKAAHISLAHMQQVGGLVASQRFLRVLPMSICPCSFSRDARRSVCGHLFLHLSPLMNSPATPPPTSPCWGSDDIHCFRCPFVLLMQCFPTPGADVGDGKEYCRISPPHPLDKWSAGTQKPLWQLFLVIPLFLSAKVTLRHLFLHRTTSGALTATLL